MCNPVTIRLSSLVQLGNLGQTGLGKPRSRQGAAKLNFKGLISGLVH
jgi:hypothetical protein